MINFDDYANENKTEHNPKDHTFQIVHAEYLLQGALDQEKQMHHLF